MYLKDAKDKVGWMITHDEHLEGYYLLGAIDGEIVSWDGPHSSPAGVVKARELLGRLGYVKPTEKFIMVRFGEVPAPKKPPKLNESAIAACKMILGAEGK